MAINVPIVSQFVPDGLDKAVSEFKKLETTGQKVGLALEKAFLPAVAAVGALAAGAVMSAKAAADDAREQAQLARQIRASTAATEAQIAATNEYIMQQELLSAISADELRPALAILVRHTGDLAKAQELLSLAMDVSVGTGRDVFDVAERMAEGFTGVLTPLEELDYGLVQSIENGASFDQIMGSLANTFGGAVSRDAETAAGRFARMQVQMKQVQIAVGAALLPILESLLPTLERMATFVGDNTELIIGLGIAVGGIAATIIAANIAMKAWNAIAIVTKGVNLLLGTSFSMLWVATGVGIIIAIIAAVVALQLKFDIFGKAVNGLKILFDKLWDAAKWALGNIIDFINVLIRAWNKLPLVDDIPEISTDFLEMKAATDEVATGIDNVTATALNAEYQMAELRRQTNLSELQMSEALVPTLDKVASNFRNATRDLQIFYGELDRDDAIRDFDSAMAEITQELKYLTEGTTEWDAKISEALRTVQALSEALGNIPPTIEKTMLLRIQMGDIEGGLAIADLFNRGLFMEAAVESGSRFASAEGYNPNTGIYGGTTININMPAGSNGQDIIDTVNRETRRSGQAQVPIGSSVRR